MESQTSQTMYSTIPTRPTDDEEWGIEHPVLASAQPVRNQSGTDILPELKNYIWADDYFQDDNNVIAVFDHDFEVFQKEAAIRFSIICSVFLICGGLIIITGIPGLFLILWIVGCIIFSFLCRSSRKPHTALTSAGILCYDEHPCE